MENKFKIKTGKVVEINSDFKRIRVEDSQSKLESPWLLLAMPLLPGSSSFSPAKGDQVVYFEFDESSGFVIGKPLLASSDDGEEDKIKFSIGSNSFVWDLDSGSLTVTAQEIIIAGDSIKLGSGATERAALGDTLKTLLENILTAIAAHVHGDASPTATQVLFQNYATQVSTILASKTKVQ